ncbi:MAG: PadR family transcriptional regulator [Coriobacteriales bacterium]|jgi:PadR family transcriptional regulator PadR|nr:PadR family transcriptional regulator [Coriobacteriales bacterium]
MENLSEMLKGVLEGMMLQIINQKEVYGYQIVKQLQELGFNDISEGTVYTILTRLERKRMVLSTRMASELGPPRKFFRLSHRGQQELSSFWERWNFLQARINDLQTGVDQ